MTIRLIQTCDRTNYKVLFDITARASARFCALQGIDFAPFIGLKRGFHPWQATFNRIPLLHELAAEGFRGWVIYLDADAYPYDLRFDLGGYLAANAHWGIIAAAGGHGAYMPNAGIMLLDLGNAAVRAVIEAWHDAFLRELPEALLRASPDWIEQDDQYLLHPILHRRGDADRLVKIEGFALIGWPRSSFLRQILRGHAATFGERCERALLGVEEALARDAC